MKKPATGGSRFLELAGLTASVAGRYAGSKLKALVQSADEAARARSAAWERSGAQISRTLGELKGAAMKVGQMASLAGDLLPRELVSALATLQRQAPPMPFETIAAQVERELGASPDALFGRFDRAPFAAASIGQVHRARVDGREVVVKVQYPGVEESVDSDLAHLKIALRASGLLRMPKAALDAIFAEMRDRLREELDYRIEAANVRLFREFHAARHPFVTVPEVIGERSSRRILTLSYEPGDTLGSITQASCPQAVRDAIGENLARAFLAQLFDLQAIQADPNPANFAARRDGTLILYDFGCVKRLPDEVLDSFRSTLRAALDGDYEAVDRGLIELGVRRADGDPIEASFYAAWREVLLEPLLADAYDYGASRLTERAAAMAPGVLERMASLQPAARLAFLDRAIAGHYGNLRNLGARLSLGPLVRAHLV